jgi:flagellar basal-body rod protein FlgC
VNLEPIEPQTMTTSTSTVPGTDPATGTTGSTALASPAAVAAPASVAGLAGSTPIDMADATGGVRVASIGEDTSDGAYIYDPGNPDADKNGYVRMPNVNMSDELMDLMNVRRLYEANATVFQVARAMLHQAVSI